MTTIDQTAFARLDSESRLYNSVHKGPTKVAGRYGYRGALALVFHPQMADEKRPPDIYIDQVMTIAQAGEKTIPFMAAYVHSFEYLQNIVDVLGDLLSPSGKYFLFCNNIDLLKKYNVEINGINFYVLPIEESTVNNELLELLRIEKNDLKKMDTAGKLDVVADKALSFSEKFPTITYQEGLGVMGPVRNRNENRPV